MSLRALIIHSDDNVANLIGPGTKGDSVECTTEGEKETRVVTLLDDIPANHKLAPVDIKSGEPIVKYGLNIGRASCGGPYVSTYTYVRTRPLLRIKIPRDRVSRRMYLPLGPHTLLWVKDDPLHSGWSVAAVEQT